MLIWIFIGVLLLIAEVITSTFFIIFFSLAALSIAASLYFISFPLPFQILTFALLAFIYLAFSRKFFKNKKKTTSLVYIDESLLHRSAFVYEKISPLHPGKVLIGDTLWTATASQEIEKNQQVKVISHHNLTVEVQPL